MADTDSGTESKSSSSAQLRKIKKPIIEKRRRERINESLNQVKSLVLDALNKDESRFSKMEKADILEMTVKHLKSMQRRQQQVCMAASIANRYTAGFSECAQEVKRYLSATNNLNPDVHTRLMSHLNTVAQRSTGSSNVTAPASSEFPYSNAPILPAKSAPPTPIVPVLSSQPLTIPTSGIVTLVTQETQSRLVPKMQNSDSNQNVIPLYINTSLFGTRADDVNFKSCSPHSDGEGSFSQASSLSPLSLSPNSPQAQGIFSTGFLGQNPSFEKSNLHNEHVADPDSVWRPW